MITLTATMRQMKAEIPQMPKCANRVGEKQQSQLSCPWEY